MPPAVTVERRKDVRHPASFAFWLRRGDAEPQGAYMLNWSAGGAAFVTEAARTPRLGERVRLSEMASSRAEAAARRPPLPRAARVVRLDDPYAELRRVAVKFEGHVDAQLESRLSRRALRSLAAPTACGLPAPA